MRILYLDIDCLRPDHLGCYGYHRKTSPHIDGIAAMGVRFDNVYVSDAPCLPSRTALFTQRFGFQNGVVNHGGRRAELYPDGRERGFADRVGRTSWLRAFRDAGFHTVSVSPFLERHSAWHFAAGLRELHNTGRRGLESAHEVAGPAMDWLTRHGAEDNWFLHVNFWDPHTPYRAPEEEGDPFSGDALPSWYSEDVRRDHFTLPGPHSAQEAMGFDDASEKWAEMYPRQPFVISDIAQARRMFDGYDTGVLYADRYVGQLLAKLSELGVQEETAIWLSGDHGENLGELNVYGDHQTADQFTCRVPSLVVVPGVTESQAGRVDTDLYYQMDVGATLLQLAGGTPHESWDSCGFEQALRGGVGAGRDALTLSQAAWTCQRSLRFRRGERELIWVATRHDGFHDYPDEMLFDLSADPHEQHDLHLAEPALCDWARAELARWRDAQLAASDNGDPLDEVMAEGGPKHVRDELATYLDRLRATGRGTFADAFSARVPTKP